MKKQDSLRLIRIERFHPDKYYVHVRINPKKTAFVKTVSKRLLILMVMALSMSGMSCKQDTRKKIQEAQEAVEQEAEAAAEKAREAADQAGEAIKEAAEEVKEAAADAAQAVSDEIKKVQVTFDNGARSKTLESSITGREIVDYKLDVKEGQYMNISMATRHGATYFNLMEPGQEYEAIYNASINGNQFEGIAAKSGDYTIRVYMMRSAARRGETAEYRLEMIVGD